MASSTRVTLAVLSTLVAAGTLVGCDGADPVPSPTSSTSTSTTATPSPTYTVPTGFGPDECPFVDAATLAAADPTGTFGDPVVKYVSGSATCSFVFAVSAAVPAPNGVLTLQLSDGSPADLAVQQSEVYAAAPAPDLGADILRLTGLPENVPAGQIQLGVLEPVDGTQSLLITLLVDPAGSTYTFANVGAFADAVATAITLS